MRSVTNTKNQTSILHFDDLHEYAKFMNTLEMVLNILERKDISGDYKPLERQRILFLRESYNSINENEIML